MVKNPKPEEEKIIKDIRNLFRLNKEQTDTAIKDIRNLFRLKKETREIKYIVLRNIKNLFEYEKEEESYYKPVKVNTFQNNNYIEYKSNSDKNRILSVEEYFNKITPYLRGIVNDLKQSDIQKIQLTIAIRFISSKNDNGEDRIMHSESQKIEIMSSYEAGEVIIKLFHSLKNRY